MRTTRNPPAWAIKRLIDDGWTFPDGWTKRRAADDTWWFAYASRGTGCRTVYRAITVGLTTAQAHVEILKKERLIVVREPGFAGVVPWAVHPEIKAMQFHYLRPAPLIPGVPEEISGEMAWTLLHRVDGRTATQSRRIERELRTMKVGDPPYTSRTGSYQRVAGEADRATSPHLANHPTDFPVS